MSTTPSPARRFDAVMFDLDGTLADTLRDICTSANFALHAMGRPTIELPRYRYLAGQGAESLMCDALGKEHQHLVPQGVSLFKDRYARHGLDFTGPYAGIPALLDEILRQGLKIAVLSNKPDPAVRQVMQAVFSKWKWDALQGASADVPLKPDPTGAHAVARQMNIAPARWLYLGDTRVDMETAVRAGMYPVGVLWGFRDEPELRAAGAQAIVKHPSEVTAVMGR